MLANGLKTHSLYNYTGYILSYMKIVYKHRNIPVQVKDGCRLLIKTIVFIEHFSVKEILLHGLYSSWKTFTLLYRLSTVHSLCHDAAYKSCGASSRAPHAYQHPPVKPANRARCCLSCRPLQKRWFSCQLNQPLEEDFFYHLGWLSVTVRAVLQSKAPFSNPPKLCGTLCWPPNCRWLVTLLPQDNVELHFHLFFTAYLNGGWLRSVAKLWK